MRGISSIRISRRSVLAGAGSGEAARGRRIGATLATQPGVAERSFGPGPARPVIRGLDGDRVLILDDGQRVGDLSSQSGDHGVIVNPAGSSKIEVVRGPATLLYGSNAIGGLVNVISDTIPTEARQRGARRNDSRPRICGRRGGRCSETCSLGTTRWAVARVGERPPLWRCRHPEGTIDNSQSRGGFASVGLACTGEQGYFGGSYGYDNTKYGMPYVEEGQVELTPRRQMFGLCARADDLKGAFASFRVPCSVTGHINMTSSWAEEVGTQFENNTTDLNFQAKHQPMGTAHGDDRRIVPDAGVQRHRRRSAVPAGR